MIGLYTKNIASVWFGVACDEKEIFATTFASSQNRAHRDLLKSIPFDIPFQLFKKPSAFAEHVIAILKNVYDGIGSSQSLPLATEHLSRYARRVIEAVSLIPLGYVASYGSVARVVGGSPRAVGRVMAMNPFAPIVPCHRVISSDFTLGGYGGGLDVKLAFLGREKLGYTAKSQISADGQKLEVFPTEFVLKRLERGKC